MATRFITVSCLVEGDDLLKQVADTGGGIPENLREIIFDPFFTTKDVDRGSGQGLAISRTIVHNKHGGEFSYDSRIS